MGLTQVSEKGIKDGEILNADINASAAIAGTKISTDFGSQDITTTGNASVGETVTVTGNNPNITFTDSNNNPDFKIYGSNGSFSVLDSTNSATRFAINSTGNIDIGGNLDVGSGIDVTGNSNLDGKLTITQSNSTIPEIELDGDGPNFIRFNDDAGGTNGMDLVFRSSPNTIGFETSDNNTPRFTVNYNGQASFSSNLDVGGGLDVTGNINLTGELNMIAGSDGQRFFDARVGSSALTFRGTTGGDANHQELARFFRDGGCELNHAGNKKFETNSDGIKTSGRSEVTGQYGSSHYISNTTNSVYGYTTMNHGGYMTISADEGNTGSGPAIRFRVGGGTVGLWRDGGGLCFNGDTAAANALDDYEEGSYTPSVDAWSGYTSVFGYYVKIGKLVNAWGAVEDPSSTTSGSAVQISLPYTSTANTHGLGGAGGVMTENVNLSSGIETVVYVKPNDSKFRIYHTTNSNWATVNGDDCNSSSYIYFHVTYYIS